MEICLSGWFKKMFGSEFKTDGFIVIVVPCLIRFAFPDCCDSCDIAIFFSSHFELFFIHFNHNTEVLGFMYEFSFLVWFGVLIIIIFCDYLCFPKIHCFFLCPVFQWNLIWGILLLYKVSPLLPTYSLIASFRNWHCNIL